MDHIILYGPYTMDHIAWLILYYEVQILTVRISKYKRQPRDQPRLNPSETFWVSLI